MGLALHNLDQKTRSLMIEEIEADIKGRGLYVSNYLNDRGANRWSDLLIDSARSGTDDTLAAELAVEQCFKDKVERKKPKGGFTMAAVPHTANQTLAESQFNMYYMRALARRAGDEGLSLIVYRAKAVEHPRPESEAMIGNKLDPKEVLNVLRETKGVEPSINIPLPNSGLSIRLT
jgi:hypothetical protein